jgi:hypothetical protein
MFGSGYKSFIPPGRKSGEIGICANFNGLYFFERLIEFKNSEKTGNKQIFLY